MKFGAAALTLLLLSANLSAEQQAEEKDLEELLSIVQQETQLATKTRMNSDYVPGIVTVLNGDDLEALGIANAGEALGLIPGILAARDRNGAPSVIVRGLDFPFNSGNIQIQINSIPLVRADSGFNSAALLIPVEQIERIEVIRGPGSVVYGDYAFMGLVNIITRNEGSRLFLRASTPHPTFEGGARTKWKSFALNVAGTTSDNAVFPTRNADDHQFFGIGTASFGDLALTAQLVRRQVQAPNGTKAYDENSSAFEAKYTRAFSPALNATARATWLHNRLAEPNSAGVGSIGKLAADITWTGFRRQSWLLGADYSNSTIDKAYFRPAPPPGQPPGPLTLLVSDADRDILGITLQDRIDLSNKLTLTIGARFDSYSDFDDRITPRIALVWRANDRHILKAQYTEGFRPPTFFELYSPVPPGRIARYAFEVNSTSELNYVYRSSNSVGRATVFHSVIANMIRPGGFLTDPNAQADGVELEWSQQLAQSLKIDANISYVDTTDPRAVGPGFPERSNPVGANWLGNLSVFYRPMRGLVAAGRLYHIGDREGGKGFDTIDLTISREDAFVRGLDLRAGLKNSLDDDVTYLTALPNGNILVNAFPGRSVFVQISWRK
ncbi:MAG TPA: TonB-dependent receptor [Thermoanaerobaculia bacterium]|nr:TonB-dependent receptor [Thermoanaerobaculia bacterium]